jgi:hypothetical protein
MQSYRIEHQQTTFQEAAMFRLFPMTWTALHVGLAGAATYLLCSTDLLNGPSIFLLH